MKLIEKLALKFGADCINEKPILGMEAFAAHITGRHEGYLAGFEKAREMAAARAWNAGGDSEEYHDIKNLGEEDV